MPNQFIPNQLPADNKQKLRKEMEASFNIDELKTLSVDLGIKFENIPADTLEGIARELIELMERNKRLDEFITEMKEARPDSNWDDALVIDPDALELVEHRQVCRVDGLVSVHAPHGRNPDGKLALLLQNPRLNGGGV